MNRHWFIIEIIFCVEFLYEDRKASIFELFEKFFVNICCTKVLSCDMIMSVMRFIFIKEISEGDIDGQQQFI